MQECRWVVCEGLLFWGQGAAFGLNVCSLFSQCVQTTPLIGGVLVNGLACFQGRWNQWAGPVANAWLLGP